jgi:peptidylprolyl isomerase
MLISPENFTRQQQVNTKDQAFMGMVCKPGGIVWLLAIGVSPICHAQQTWRVLDPENALVIDTAKGRLIVEMRPEIAPKSVGRVKMLAREKIYNGLQFHRVIGDFVAQTGNPNNKDGGKTVYPNLAPEMTFKHQRNSGEVWASNASDTASGFLGSVPFQTIPISVDKQSLLAWGAHCAGVMGMGRDKAWDSANSEIYFMLGASRDMDHDYTAVGRVVVGMDVLLALKQGEPPASPDIMQSVRLLADLPAAERPTVSVMTGNALSAFIDKVRHEKAADFSVCDVVVPVRIE